jgi:hypothetical protein
LPISGFAAPARTQSATIERATSAALSRAIAPSAIKSSSSGRGSIAMSKIAPSWIARFKAALSRNSTSTAALCVRSKRGTTSLNSGRMAPPLKILIRCGCGTFASTSSWLGKAVR